MKELRIYKTLLYKIQYWFKVRQKLIKLASQFASLRNIIKLM